MIDRGSFSNNCDLVKVTIPASVTTIGEGAFKGCHSLRTVIFTDATKIESIGDDAFRTQEVISTNCNHSLYSSTNTGVEKPYLYFVGAMLNQATNEDTETFKYAMNKNKVGAINKISRDDTNPIWITCHSGWPTNLEVEYYYDEEENTGEAQLVGYPRYSELENDAQAWAEKLPYVTNEPNNTAEYYAYMIGRALHYNQIKDDKEALNNFNPKISTSELAFLAATLNPVIPASVDSIKPELFSKTIPGTGEEGDTVEADTCIESILINGVTEIEPYTFKNCTGLKRAEIIGSSLIDDYAFEGCTSLENVTLGTNLIDTGKRPFKGCSNISSISCLDGSCFEYNSGILYRRVGNGLEIVECLENRGKTGGTGLYTVGPDELAGVKSIKPEAFEDCNQIAQVDLSKTEVGTIPDSCFKNMALNSIVLPNTLSKIDKDAFAGGESRRFVVYYKNSNPITMIEDAFEPKDGNRNSKGDREVIFQCAIPSNAATYAEDYKYITVSDAEVYQEYVVKFYNTPNYPASTDLELLSTQTIRAGANAEAPSTEGLTCKDSTLVFIGWDKPFTNVQSNLDVLAMYGTPQYTVTFIDSYTGDKLKTETVASGGSATPPEAPDHTDEGQLFMGWSAPYHNIKQDTDIFAKYVDSSGDINRHLVSFYLDSNDTEAWWTTYAKEGEEIKAPIPDEKEGYTFDRWVWVPAASEFGVKQDTSVYAQWKTGSSSNNSGNSSGGNGGNSGNGGGSGSNSSNNSNGSSSSKASPSPSPTSSSSDSVKKYTVSVSGGSGSGSYAAGAIVAINAYERGTGQRFDRWTTSSAGVGFANAEAVSTTFTMPAANVAITATYKTDNGSNSGSGGSSNSGSSSGSSTSSANNSGTTVEVTKPGISNTNLAGATVSGATDNFVVKVTEDQSATNAVVAALQAKYGDISRIKYLPMDISLYDSTGRTKIADTSGITVNLTLPLPDDLAQYAGNNKVAAVSNGALEDLNARFTTVDGVPCVNFTATHFSPYVIYVDTANLTEGTIDATPKTGDPIHPKWFLALGLACISMILFFKKDKAVVKAKTA